MFFEWPTQEDWQIIEDRYPFQEVLLIQKLEASLEDFGRARATVFQTTLIKIYCLKPDEPLLLATPG